MANKRMIRKDVIDTDAFLDMPLSTQALYFHLNLRADDDGFVGNPKRVSALISASEDDLKLLIAKKFVILFENGVIVIKHWRMHNTLSANRYHETNFTDEKSMLRLKDNKSYTLGEGQAIDDSHLIEMSERQAQNDRRTKDEQKTNSDKDIDKELDKDIDINNKKEKTKRVFKQPTVDEVRAYCQERGNFVDPESFINFYESKGWMVGSNKMKDWKAAVRTWESKDKKRGLIPKQNQPIKTVRIEKQPQDETMKFPYYGLPKEWFKGDMITSALIDPVRDADTGKEYTPDEIVDLYYLRRERALGDGEDLEFRHGT